MIGTSNVKEAHMTARPTVLLPTAVLLLLLLGGPANAGQQADKGGDQATASIQRMSDFLAATKQFGVTIETGYDVVQDWGQKIEFGETRVVTVRRPDHIRVDTTDREGSTSGLVFDGKQIAFFDTSDKAYATLAKPGSLDAAISYFVNDLGMRLPMAGFLSVRLPQMLSDWANNVAYVDQSTIAGVPCDHVALSGNWEDIQMWIARGDKPLLQRLVITYKRAEGQPQFWAQFSNWNLSPSVPDSAFSFTPPKGLAKISFAAVAEGVQPGGTGSEEGQP